jgi:hypothetical protein
LSVLFAAAAWSAAACERFVLAQGGTAAAAIVLGEKPCAASTNMAATLKTMLERITGASFTVAPGDGTAGLAVGLAVEFPALADEPALKLMERFGPTDLATRQSYILRSHDKGVQLIGASELGVAYAAWDFLHRLGYRQFFPGPVWEVVPQRPDLVAELDAFEKPDFILRHIAGSVTPDWCLKNRANPILGWQNATEFPWLPGRWTASMAQAQHNWGSIVGYAEEEFKAHPEYLGLVTVKVDPRVAEPDPTALAPRGVDDRDVNVALTETVPVATTKQVRVSSKLCVSNPRVRELAGLYALDYFEKNPESPSVSMEPTDGSGWCECSACSNVGPPSERVALLANSVAEALEEKHPDKYVAILAYHLHADPPVRKLHPRVAVSLATALSGSTPLDERLTRWAAVSENLGVYEYLSVMEWHLGLPAKSLVSNLPYLAKQIPYYRGKNVRFFTGQATAGAWGGHGLGYYVTGRLLWHTNEAQRVESTVDDFLERAFGDAAEPLREYWRVVDGSQQKPGSYEFFLDRATRMYAALKEARAKTEEPAVRKRIDQLTLYARYVELFARHGQAKGAEKWPALCRFVRHAYRMREANMVGYGVVLGYVPGAKTVELRPLLRPTAEEQALMEPGTRDNRVDEPFTEAEIGAMLDGSYRDPVPAEEAPAPAELLDGM